MADIASVRRAETLAEAVERAVAASPPLTAAQKATLTAAFASVTLRVPLKAAA